jgi:hypothetical protein
MNNYYPFVEVKIDDYLSKDADLSLTKDEEKTATTVEVIFLNNF